MTTAITLLDGGMGQELIRRSSAAKPHPLWSLQVMMDEPELVANVHRDFCLAGARVICLNTYSVTRHRLQMGNELPDLHELLKHAGDLARAGIQASGLHGIDVVASLPPLTASYLKQSPLSPTQMKDEYKELMELQRHHVDGFLAETLSSVAEGEAVLRAAQEAGTGVHLAFTVQDEDGTLLRSGESLEDALRACVPLKQLSVILNCSIPEAIDQGLPLVAQATEIFGAYANGFHSVTALKPGGTVDVLTAREDLTPAAYTDMSLQWLELGASILGGCCEVGPAHIEALAQGIVGKGRQLSGLPAEA